MVMLKNLTLKKSRPDCVEFMDILLGKTNSHRVPLVEYIVDDVVLKPIITELLGRQWIEPSENKEIQKAYLDNFIQFWYRMGYDFVRFEQPLPFNKRMLVTNDVGADKSKKRTWVDLHEGNISSWENFESYPWPTIEEMNFWQFEYINAHLPEGMGFITCHGAGIFENVSQLMSYEGLSLALFDDPPLVQAVTNKVAELLCAFYNHLLDLDNVITIFQGDDMGFRTGTLISPADLRKYFLPWLTKLAALTHAKNRPFFLHSCGNLATIYDDLIEQVKIDGKHSFEDLILPVDRFQQIYGDKIAVLGGVDINILAKGTTDDVRQRTRFLRETCGSRGRYAIGSGNSIPSYIPVGNYLAMIDEALAG
jgi:uroporphyrinogen decarboxylase